MHRDTHRAFGLRGVATLATAFLSAPAVMAVELAPELRLPALEGGMPDIRRRPEEARTVTPLTRPRPELDPLGARIRSFVLWTRVDLKADYNDNVFATDGHERSDYVAVVAPDVQLRSDWSRHALAIGGTANSARHQDFSGENYDDWRVFTDGRLDFGRASSLSGHASLASQHEDRASPDSTPGGQLSSYKVSELQGGWLHPFGRFQAQLNTTFDDYSFDDRSAVGLPAGTLVGSDRDRKSTVTEGRLRYTVWPGYGAFVRGAYNTQRYDQLAPGGVNRDSDGYEAGLGLDIELTDLIFGNGFIGYYKQNYEAPGVPARDGLGFGADVYWNVTRLSTLHFQTRRSVRETIQAGTFGAETTDTSLELEHELLRNLVLVAGGHYTRRRYDGLDRQETLKQFSFGANYLTNRHLQLRLQLVHRQQDANGGGASFDQNFVEQTIVLQH
jgi:hypothetical protein